jgi:hypothetical protein
MGSLKGMLVAYAVLYTLGFSFLFIAYWRLVPAGEKDEPVWKTLLDILLATAGLTGMLLMLFRIEYVPIKLLWRPVSIALVAGQLWVNLAGRSKWMASAEAMDTRTEARLASVTTLILLAPALLINLIYAFRG